MYIILGFIIGSLLVQVLHYRKKAKRFEGIYNYRFDAYKELESKFVSLNYKTEKLEEKHLKVLHEYQKKINDLELLLESSELISAKYLKIEALKEKRSNQNLEIDINVRPQPYDYKEEFDRYKDTRGMRFVEGTKDVIDLGNVGSQEPVKHESNYISPSASHDTYTHNNHSNNWSSSNSSSNDSYSSSDSSSCDSGSSSGGCD